MEPLALTLDQTAEVLQLSRAKTYRLAAEGHLPTVKFGPRSTRVPLAELQRRLAGAADTPTPAALPTPASPPG